MLMILIPLADPRAIFWAAQQVFPSASTSEWHFVIAKAATSLHRALEGVAEESAWRKPVAKQQEIAFVGVGSAWFGCLLTGPRWGWSVYWACTSAAFGINQGITSLSMWTATFVNLLGRAFFAWLTYKAMLTFTCAQCLQSSTCFTTFACFCVVIYRNSNV